MTPSVGRTAWWRRLAALVLIGIVLSPLRAVAATIPVLFAYDSVAPPTAMVRVETGPSLRRERGSVHEHVYDGAHDWYGDAANPPVVGGEGGDHAYDRAVEPLERREAGGGVIYDAPTPRAAAEGLESGATALSRDAHMWEGMGQLSHGGGISADTALESGAKWVGDGYREVAPGVFQSSDGLRQFRMMTEESRRRARRHRAARPLRVVEPARAGHREQPRSPASRCAGGAVRLRANVVKATGATVHRHAKFVKGVVVPGAQIAKPESVEIDEARAGGFYLYHYDAAGRCIADTWHATLAEAKEQAKFEFEIDASDWVEVTN